MSLLGNTQLINYGIQNEESDIRVHVGVLAQKVYIFNTQDGNDSICGYHQEVPVYTDGILTAKGYIVPVEDVIGCRMVDIPHDIYEASDISNLPEIGYQSEKGRAAVYIVTQMLSRGLIPIPFKIDEVDDKKMQIKGIDINTQMDMDIQIKCDYRAGNGHHRCTGNLFLQIAECNPFHIY